LSFGIKVLFVINSMSLAFLTGFLSLQIAGNIKFKKAIKENINKLNKNYNEKRLLRELRKYTGLSVARVSVVEKIELYLIDKSNIKNYIPFVNFYILLLCCTLIFIISFRSVYKITLFIPSTVILCCLASLTPVFILDIMGRYNSEKIRKKLAGFISVLNRWCAVKEDIFHAFEKSIESGVSEPLKTYIRDMIVQVNRGVEPMEALSILQMKVDNPQFRDFIINIKQNVKHRGDIRNLLENMEEQFYKIEEEFNRRKISTYKDRIVIYCIMVLVLIIGYAFLKLNPEVEQFYLATYQGKTLLTVFCMLYALGFYLTLGITKFDV